jgi:FkbM family methyltransferase
MNFTISLHPPGEYISDTIRKKGFWEGITSEILMELIRETNPPLFIDIGANIGWFSLLCASYGVPCVAFEPIRANAELFRSSVKDNRYEKLIEVNQVCLGRTHSSVFLNISSTNMGACSTRDIGGRTGVERCELRRLDSYELARPGILKIDVEESELEVLEGAQETLRRCAYLIIEISKYESRVFEILRATGFVYCIELGFDAPGHVLSTSTSYIHTPKYFTTLDAIEQEVRHPTTILAPGQTRQKNLLFGKSPWVTSDVLPNVK